MLRVVYFPVKHSCLYNKKCWTRLTRNDLARFTKHSELYRYFAPEVVYVVIPREVWIQHNAKILKLIDLWQDSVPCPLTVKLSTRESLWCVPVNITLGFTMRYHRRYIFDVGYKQQGTDQDPCGTPNETDWRSDVDRLTTTLCVLSVK